ncbi:MAG: hypothetical protein ACI8P7_001147, partial [Candidatus Azotimanducaceae bacterium]
CVLGQMPIIGNFKRLFYFYSNNAKTSESKGLALVLPFVKNCIKSQWVCIGLI